MKTRNRIEKLSAKEKAAMPAWAAKWIEIGLRTGPADRTKFEAAARECYRYAGVEWPGVVVWVPSPLALAFAAPAAAFATELIQKRKSRDAVDGAVGGAVDGAVDGAVGGAVDGAVRGAVRDAVDGAVGGAVDGAVGGAVGGAVDGAVRGAVGGAVRDAVRDAVHQAISRSWNSYIGGQFWVGGWCCWGPAYTSFFRDVCGLGLAGDLWDRARAYEATAESACWWWPHRRFVMVSERPLEIHRELVDPARPSGPRSHRLHRDDGPAIVWPDGWGLYCVHGVQVPAQAILAPETLTIDQIRKQDNVEVKRIMIERVGWPRYLREVGAKVLDTRRNDGEGTVESLMAAYESRVLVCACPSTGRVYALEVPREVKSCREAQAWLSGGLSERIVSAS